MARYEHSGDAQDARLLGTLAADGLGLTIDGASGWPTGATYKFWIAIDPDTAKEEHILCNLRTGTALTVASIADRGKENTTAVQHDPGAIVRHIFSATEADDMALLSATNTFTAAQTFADDVTLSKTGPVFTLGGAVAHSSFKIRGDGTGYQMRWYRRDNTPTDTQLGYVDDRGLFAFLGQTHKFGAGALGGAAGYTQFGDDAGGHALVVAGNGTAANANLRLQSKGTGTVRLEDSAGNAQVLVTTSALGFNGATPVSKQTISGSRGGNAALADLLTKLALTGLITDGTSA